MSIFMFPGQAAQIQAPERALVTTSTEHIYSAFDTVMQERYGIHNFSQTKIFSEDSSVTFNPSESQAANFVNSLARAIIEEEEKGRQCDVCVGDSAGEHSMIAFAGVHGDRKDPQTVRQGIEIMLNRGELYAQCRPNGEAPTRERPYTIMFVGIEKALLEDAVAQIPPELGKAWVSKSNDAKSNGIGGEILAVKFAADYLVREYDVPRRYCIPVLTDAPVHTPLMERARRGMEKTLAPVKFHQPNKKVIMMYSGKQETDPSKIKQCLTGIIDTTADFNRSIVHAVSMGFKDVVLATVCKMYKKMIKRRKDVKPVD
ncbi:hypothetical protein KY338_06340 [Candidatus Woesearchaeota archaeon]|nr:hypothetical protein [Candidatus Woesearchaeota archaeon]MBW3005518.1 hypothetical protein [Candidatus Woesearchaeota archaeon]